mmetsp:Transcript_41814/g.112745  ORF Transcript_41814/g.112745 Transcript_41814/m.112745 type:complete len:286 (-) Transcript_41814:577-1434(-)
MPSAKSCCVSSRSRRSASRALRSSSRPAEAPAMALADGARRACSASMSMRCCSCGRQCWTALTDSISCRNAWPSKWTWLYIFRRSSASSRQATTAFSESTRAARQIMQSSATSCCRDSLVPREFMPALSSSSSLCKASLCCRSLCRPSQASAALSRASRQSALTAPSSPSSCATCSDSRPSSGDGSGGDAQSTVTTASAAARNRSTSPRQLASSSWPSRRSRRAAPRDCSASRRTTSRRHHSDSSRMARRASEGVRCRSPSGCGIGSPAPTMASSSNLIRFSKVP